MKKFIITIDVHMPSSCTIPIGEDLAIRGPTEWDAIAETRANAIAKILLCGDVQVRIRDDFTKTREYRNLAEDSEWKRI